MSKLKVSLFASLLFASSFSFAETTVDITKPVKFDIINKGKEYEYSLSSVIDMWIKGEHNTLNDQEKMEFVMEAESLHLNEFEKREQAKELIQRYNQYVQKAKNIIESIDYFTVFSYLSKMPYDEDKFSKKYDFDSQTYYFIGSPDKEKELEDFNKRSRGNQRQIGWTSPLCVANNRVGIDERYFGPYSGGSMQINIPECKSAYIDFPAEEIKKLFYPEGKYSDRVGMFDEYNQYLKFKIKNNKKIIKDESGYSLDTTVEDVEYYIATQDGDNYQIYYSVPIKYTK